MNKVHWKRKQSKRPVRKKKRKLPLPSFNFKFNFGINFKKLFLIILIPVVGVLTYMLLSSNLFLVKNIEIYGTNQLSDEPLINTLENFNNRNIFTVNTTAVKDSISSSSIFLKDIYVEKNLPGTLGIYVVERFPDKVVINFQGAFLVDSDNVVVKVLSKTEGLYLNPGEKDILLGFTDYESAVIKKKIYAEIPEEEREEFNFKEIDTDVKVRLYRQILNNMNQTITKLFDQNTKAVNTTEFANFEKIYILDNEDYEIGDEVKERFVKFPEDVIAYFREKEEFTTISLTWTDDFTLQVETLEDKTFIFTTRRERELWKQFQDLERTLHRLEIEQIDFSQIDVTVSTISVE